MATSFGSSYTEKMHGKMGKTKCFLSVFEWSGSHTVYMVMQPYNYEAIKMVFSEVRTHN